jgi:hypothetical protein
MPSGCKKVVMVAKRKEYSHLSWKRMSFTISVPDSDFHPIYSYLLVLRFKNPKKLNTLRADMKGSWA